LYRYWDRAKTFLKSRVLHTDDSPHVIALGAAIATFVSILPIMGVQTAVALGLAHMVRANKAICIPTVAITNPITAVPIYGACLRLGRWVMSLVQGGAASVADDGTAVVVPELGFAWKLVHLGREMWIGCTIVGLVCAILGYWVVRWGVIHYRLRRQRRLLLRKAG